MELIKLLVIIFILISIIDCRYSDSIWGSGMKLVLDPNGICRKTGRLKGKQTGICEKEPEMLREMSKGAKMAIKECEFQFRNRQWNCTTVRRSMRKVLERDTRETGFVHAITAAGITYSLARACSQGNLLGCSCHQMVTAPSYHNQLVPLPPNTTSYIMSNHEFDFRGCGNNVDFGYQKSKEILESRLKKDQVQSLVLMHNYEAGRLSVKRNMKKACKCHGMSGSCTLQTCWHKLPSFRDVGVVLKDKFDGASKVIATNDGRSFTPEVATIKLPSSEDLVYSEESPDFCIADKSTGSLGTQGRECNITSKGVDGCELLCCGRGTLTNKKTVKEACRCRFNWCCEVVCEVCTSKKTISTCK
ncbi:protein Wnt-6-like isoform X1 [Panonychus citri]|uniref:protein Wnt-6-like isoform X1 n=1 Tax=Panonychus citri TaxID=50023 RepID=UPI002308230A|nr:protein Wnt-6-like isoform X1 [Panonychus citri]